MDIIIPAAGTGNRFKNEGYSNPKPLINVLGTPLICYVINNLNLGASDNVYIIYNQILDNYQFKYIVSKNVHNTNTHFVPISFTTRGAAETVLCGLNKMINLDEKVLILDCDTFYIDDIVAISKNEPNNLIFYFKDYSDKNIFSYIETNENNDILNIKEKIKISNNACTGAYGFKDGNTLKKYCELILKNESKSKGEYYISDVYNLLIQNNEKVVAHEVNDFNCLGTPPQLQSYCINYDNKTQPKRFCFDLDNTLFSYPEEDNNYKTVKPINKNINLLKYLKGLGHTIIIYTARKMKSSNNNVGKAIKEAHEDVFSILEDHKVPFDEIYFGKPFAHFYIDDLSVKPFEHLEKEMGFYNGNVAPRHFNKIEYVEGITTKTTNNDGEIHWYKNIPTPIAQYFPTIFDITKNQIKMERINGILFSYLLINNSLTKYNIHLLLEVISKIHNTKLKDDVLPPNIYDNYAPKLTKRFEAFNYKDISGSAEVYYNTIVSKMFLYQKNNEAMPGIIHGDLVFSNVFLCENQMIKLIDMRGKMGDLKTIYGDCLYDYAKIYQSLNGYDFILNDCTINYSYLDELRRYFEKMFIAKFSVEKLKYLKYLTAGLLFSLIPLHNERPKQIKYFDIMKGLMSEEK